MEVWRALSVALKERFSGQPADSYTGAEVLSTHLALAESISGGGGR